MKILLFEPWHLGDVAIALSVSKEFAAKGIEFGLVCDANWKDWALSTGVVRKVIEFSPPWTRRKRKDKYNPFNYKLKEFLRFRKQVLAYAPDFILELRGDIRAKTFLNALIFGQIPIKSSNLPRKENVYKRGNQLQTISGSSSAPESGKMFRPCHKKTLTLFLGASDPNRAVPFGTAMALVKRLHQESYLINLILQPIDDLDEIRRYRDSHNLSNLNFLHGDFPKMIDCLLKSFLVVSTDSGWMHIAHFYGKKTIGLFGFDTMRTWAPPGSHVITSEKLYPYSYRYKEKYQFLRPLSNLDVEKVVHLVHKLEGGPEPHATTIEWGSDIENLGAVLK